MIKPYIAQTILDELPPPALEVGVLGWLRKNLFNSWLNSLLTVVVLGVLVKLAVPAIQWAFIDSLWMSTGEECREVTGACWSIIPNNFRFIIFGFYPQDEHWRPLISMILMVGLLIYSKDKEHWNSRLPWIWVSGLTLMGILMKGGILGLTDVETDLWSGLPLTMLLAVFGMFAAYPLGVLLALGRRSQMPAVRSLCVCYIELIRGVPLISLLFMSSVMFPLFLPEGMTINKILRAQIAIILFTAAYIAEVVRGGLQAMPKGQYEAADAIGLNFNLSMRLIVLPQALKIVIPPTVGVLISAFKDTSLVVIIALYDILKTTQSMLSDPEWMGYSTEAYIFLALLYFVGCYSMSSYSRKLERDLHTGR